VTEGDRFDEIAALIARAETFAEDDLGGLDTGADDEFDGDHDAPGGASHAEGGGLDHGEGPPVPPPADPQMAERIRRASELDHSDTDNAQRLIIHFGDRLRVMGLEGERNADYIVWCGTHWDAKGGPDAAIRLAQQIGDLIQAEADFLTATPAERAAIEAAEAARPILDAFPPDVSTWTDDQKARARVLREAIELGAAAREALSKRKVARRKFGISSKNKARVEAMLSMAAPHLTRPTSAWNANPYRFATLRHTHTWEVAVDDDGRRCRRLVTREGHDRADLITRVLPVLYDPEARAPRWTAFLGEMLPDVPTRRYVQTFNGLQLTGIPIQKLLFHYGYGANGKSIFLEVVSRVLGDLSVTLAPETVAGTMERSAQSATPDLARIYGRWAVRIPELPKGVPLRESLVKTLTGGEAIPVRNLFKGAFEFVPVAKAQGSGNGYPTLDGSDYGMMRRLAVVHWPVTIAKERRRDFNEMVDSFTEEWPGILNWLVDGALIYFDEGLVEPDGVEASTAELQSEMDPAGQFRDACVVESVGAEVTGREMYDAFVAWSGASGIRAMSETKFGRIMKTKLKQVSGRVRIYPDVALVNVPTRPATPHGHDTD